MNKLLGLSASLAGLTGVASATEHSANSPPMAPARDGNIAIMEELCAARKEGTAAAYDLFIARHPQHPLAAIARKERADIARAKAAQP
jgi:hypothetical protein